MVKNLVVAQGQYEEADQLYERSQAIVTTAFGPDHPKMAMLLVNRGKSLHEQVNDFLKTPHTLR